MEIIQRKDWGAKAPKETPVKMPPAQGTYIHHTVTSAAGNKPSDERAHMRYLQRIAFNRGFNDISYSFIVFPSGRVYEGRGWQIVGAHTEGSNSIAHAVSFVGNFEISEPTKDALRAAAAVIRRGLRQGRIKPNAWLRGHREAPGAATACPGDNLFERLTFIQQHIDDEED